MNDRERLRNLAKEWMELASEPVMEERKALWAKLHGLERTRPMMLIETGYIYDFVKQNELVCSDPFMRKIERTMLEKIIHTKEIGDDIVLEPCFRIGYTMHQPSYGVDVIQIEAKEKGLAYVFERVIKEPEDMRKLVKREFAVDFEASAKEKAFFEELFGDILPVKQCNYSFMDPEGDGVYDWVGTFFFGLTWQLHRFIGLDEMLYWYYDYPDAMHQMMQYMVDDRLRMFRKLEESGCVESNADNQMAGPSFYGYSSRFPRKEGKVTLKDEWAWCESQETTCISPAMYEEFVLPYLGQLSDQFGRIYYGCCEPVHDRLDIIEKRITNLGAVSVSMWNDFPLIAEKIGRKYVYSRKPAPQCISGSSYDPEAIKADIRKTFDTAKDCNVEFLFRDLYDISGDRNRLAEWVRTVKNIYGI